jgi:hypothetical protein
VAVAALETPERLVEQVVVEQEGQQAQLLLLLVQPI